MNLNSTRAAAPPALVTRPRRGRPRTKGVQPNASEAHTAANTEAQTNPGMFNPHTRSKNPAPKRRPRRKSKGTHGEDGDDDDGDDDEKDADAVHGARLIDATNPAGMEMTSAGVDPLALLRRKRRRKANEYEEDEEDEDEEEYDEEYDEEDDDFEEAGDEGDAEDENDDENEMENGDENGLADADRHKAKKARRGANESDETDASDTDDSQAEPPSIERRSTRKLRPRRVIPGGRVAHRSVPTTETEGDSQEERHDKVLQQQRSKGRKAAAAHGGSKGSATRGRQRQGADGELIGTDIFYDDVDVDDDDDDDDDHHHHHDNGGGDDGNENDANRDEDSRSVRSRQSASRNDASMMGYHMDQSHGSAARDSDAVDGMQLGQSLAHQAADGNDDIDDDQDGAHNAHTPQALKSILTPQRAHSAGIGKQGFDALQDDYDDNDDLDPAVESAMGTKALDGRRSGPRRVLELGSVRRTHPLSSGADTSVDSLQASVIISTTDQGRLDISSGAVSVGDKNISNTGFDGGDVDGALNVSSVSVNVTVNISADGNADKGASADEVRYKKARKALLLSSLPSVLPCRERERMAIESFLRSAVDEGAEGRCLYISGVPGTGKTATVLEVVRSLQRDQSLPNFRLLEMNGMKLVEPTHAYSLLWNLISKRKATPLQAQNYLDRYFGNSDENRPVCVVIIDEMDYLVTRNQSVLYNLFDWPTRANSGIITIGIANTMDLPERLMPRIASRIGKHRLTFHPYDRRQLETIIQSRLSGIDVFDQAAIGLCAGKVAAMTGDARRALEFCRKAIEIAEFGKSSTVSMQHVDACLRATLQSPVLLCIRGLSKYEKLFLCSVILELKRSGTTHVSFRRVANRLQTICANNSIYPINTSEASSVCARLASSSVLTTDSGDADIYQKIRLNPDPADASVILRQEEPFDFILGQERSG